MKHRKCTTCGEEPLIGLIFTPGLRSKVSCGCSHMYGDDIDELWEAWDNTVPFTPEEWKAHKSKEASSDKKASRGSNDHRTHGF